MRRDGAIPERGPRMVNRADGWMVAAPCSEGPRPEATFATLPPAYRQELLRFALVAAASSAFFVTLALLLRPLPSRNLAAHAVLPVSPSPRAAAFNARMSVTTDAALRPSLRRRAPHTRYEPATVEVIASAAPPTRRSNVLTRMFRGILFRPASSGLKAAPVE